jgi:hypothetical protein
MHSQLAIGDQRQMVDLLEDKMQGAEVERLRLLDGARR